jgi:hypothetical protein
VVRGIRHNIFDAQMLFERQRALELGGYAPLASGQAKALLDRFAEAGELHTWEPPEDEVSYVCRWGDGVRHISAGGNAPGSTEAFAAHNRDFGAGQPLAPATDADQWAAARLPRALNCAGTPLRITRPARTRRRCGEAPGSARP